ncbi:glycosyltransferase [Paenibacillus sp. LjRoot153]|uniref:glycosyltransferase n=1 Tax=Paenibacillus sp. LjRoot153 TaxID=3342270 RepID=UPI003ECD2D72
MRVLHILEYVKGGISTYMDEVLSYQAESTNIEDVYVLLSENCSDKNFNINPLKIKTYPYERKITSIPKAIMKINEQIKLINPDVIHVHCSFAGFFVRILYFFKRKKIKIIYCPHGWSFLMDVPKPKKLLYLYIERFLEIKTDIIINISKHEQENSLKLGLSPVKSVIIYNGVKRETSNNDIDLIVNEAKINLLFVGRFDKQKGLDILIDIFIKNNFNNIDLYLAGTSVLNNTQELDLPKNVYQLGWIPNNSIDSYYRRFDAVVIPSRWEGFGLVAIEAMKNKKCVIASNRGALPELVIDNYNGYSFSLDNTIELVKIIAGLEKEQLKILGENGYKYFIENFTSDRMNKEIIAQYNKLQNNTRRI